MTDISAINNSSIHPEMSLDDLLDAAEERLNLMNMEADVSRGEIQPEISAVWGQLLQTARNTLPESLRPYVRFARHTVRDQLPSEIAVCLDLPECERIFYGPWQLSEEHEGFQIMDPWRNKPFEVGGGNRERFGDLLDAVARAREICIKREESLVQKELARNEATGSDAAQ